MIMHPGYGVLADIAKLLRLQARSTGSRPAPLFSIIVIVAWQWLPFATLILTSLQSLDREQKEAAEMDGAGFALPLLVPDDPAHGRADHRRDHDPDDLPVRRLCGDPGHNQWRPGPRHDQPALPDLPATRSERRRRRSAGGIVAVILANIVAFFLMRAVGKNLDMSGKVMAHAVTTRVKVGCTVAAWTVALLIFFPILYTIITGSRPRRRRSTASA